MVWGPPGLATWPLEVFFFLNLELLSHFSSFLKEDFMISGLPIKRSATFTIIGTINRF